MYKKLFLFAIAGALLTACSEDEVYDNSNNTDNSIAFDTYVGKQTRASQTTGANLAEFGVYAYVNTSSPYQLIDNEKISKTQDGKWNYTNVKYWPENSTVDFFAYAPYKANWANYSSADKSFTYTIPALASTQEDLIAATSFQKDKSNGNVGLVFKHLLSRIGFSAKLAESYPGATVTVTGFEVLYKDNAVNSVNTFTFATSGDSGANEAGTWGTATAKLPGATSGELITKPVVIEVNSQSLNTSDTQGTDPNTYLMMLPQNLTDGDIQAKITYTVTYENPHAVVTNEKTINLPGTNWAMGKAYTYNFTIGMSQIVFDGITVAGWEDGASQPAPTPVQ